MGMARLARVERAPVLRESGSRQALQQVLAAATPLLHALRKGAAGRGLLRWAVDVDPVSI
jgi:primosomal protein N' (replication factor Y)